MCPAIRACRSCKWGHLHEEVQHVSTSYRLSRMAGIWPFRHEVWDEYPEQKWTEPERVKCRSVDPDVREFLRSQYGWNIIPAWDGALEPDFWCSKWEAKDDE